jgi:tRNA threonylcarbamoyladenosine biosynthesis protein TsaB
MRILAADTSTKTGSVAVVEDESLVAEYTLNVSETHSARLMPTIDRVLNDAELGIEDIDALAIAIGPGSFTGLRIGLATFKGLALAAEKKLVAVPTLDALASSISFSDHIVCPILDARMGEVYAALYKFSDGLCEKVSKDMVLAVEDLFREVDGKVVILGDGIALHRDRIVAVLGERAVFAPQRLWIPRAVNVAAIARSRVERGDSDDIGALEPIYLRQSEAERKWGKRKQK